MGMHAATIASRRDPGILLTEFDLVMNRQGFIAHRALPIVPRSKPNGEYPEIPIEQLLHRRDTRRSPGGGYPRSGASFTHRTYSTVEHGHESLLDDRTQKAYDDELDMEMWEGERITNIVLQDYEIEVADYLFNATTFSGMTSGPTNEWDDAANGLPITDVNSAREAIFSASGMEPNALILNRHVLRSLQNSAQIVDRLRYQGFQDARAGELSAQAISIALDIDQIIVAGGVSNSANPSDAASLSRIWSSEYALLARVATTDNPSEPCIGRTIIWDDESAMDGDRLAVIMDRYRDESVRSDVMRARSDWGIHPLYPSTMGYLISNVTTI